MRIFLIESIPLLREALLQQMQELENCLVVQTSGSLKNLSSALTQFPADLLWLDGSLKGAEATGIVRQVRKKFPALLILIFGNTQSIPEIKAYFKEGISAYLPKTSPLEDIRQALTALTKGRRYVPASLYNEFTAWLTNNPSSKKKQRRNLTQREQEILQLIVEEYTSIEIAKKLFISQCTVETHRINLIQKLGVRNTAGLVRVAFESGLYAWRLM
ncbi:MAG: response regulator transcription factor [Bacteroidetes bacterium]|nr:MAG: response regulator transcription factor [Bacteroidota bacterium]